ncbi:MAG: hypothetical protein KY475_17770 [Planctomycetes bacterium]|nr:hypothetical protein [Planctomycetota bacterium]
MDSTAQPQFDLASRGPLARVGLFAAAMLVLAALATPVAFALSGRVGVGCVVAAAGVCTLSGIAALAIHELFHQPQWVLVDVLTGFFLRMGVPLAFCMIVYLRGGALAEAGFAIYVLAFYFGSLIAGTVLTLPRIPAPTRGT